MKYIFEIEKFLTEAQAAGAMDQRMIDRFDTFEFKHKRGGEVLRQQRDKKEKILVEIGDSISSKYKWLTYGINRDNMISDKKWLPFDRVLYIYYSSEHVTRHEEHSYNVNRHKVVNTPIIPFADLGIASENFDDNQLDALKEIKDIELCDNESFKLNIDEHLYKRFSKFVLETHGKEVKSHKFIVAYDDKDGDGENNDNNLGIIICDWDRVSGNKQVLEALANQVVQIWIEFLRSLLPDFVK